jgi:hypothetical protein
MHRSTSTRRLVLAALLLAPSPSPAQYGIDGAPSPAPAQDRIEAEAVAMADPRPGYQDDPRAVFRAQDELYLAHLRARRAATQEEYEGIPSRVSAEEYPELLVQALEENSAAQLSTPGRNRTTRRRALRSEVADLDTLIRHFEWSVRTDQGPEMLGRMQAKANRLEREIAALEARGDGRSYTYERHVLDTVPGYVRFDQDIRPEYLERHPIEGLTPEMVSKIEAERDENWRRFQAHERERAQLEASLDFLHRVMEVRRMGPFAGGDGRSAASAPRS